MYILLKITLAYSETETMSFMAYTIICVYLKYALHLNLVKVPFKSIDTQPSAQLKYAQCAYTDLYR